VFRLLYAVNDRQNARRAQFDNAATSQHKYIRCLQTAIWLEMLYNIKHTYKKKIQEKKDCISRPAASMSAQNMKQVQN
jgi:hypothetical protein